jgi:hypothetical protein
MKITVHCVACANEGRGLVNGRVPFSDDLVLEFACPNGHRTLISLQAHRYDVLLSVATDAIIDGCHMEAVSAFNSALERFYEFYLRYRASCNGLASSDFDKAWDHLAKQSERQLGAFILEFLFHKKCVPDLIYNNRVRKGPGGNCVEFRNAVIHKGQYPREDEVLAFGQHVLDFVVPILQSIQKERPDIIAEMIRDQVVETEQVRTSRSNAGSFNCVSGLLPRIFVSAALDPSMTVPTLAEEIAIRKAERARADFQARAAEAAGRPQTTVA